MTIKSAIPLLQRCISAIQKYLFKTAVLCKKKIECNLLQTQFPAKKGNFYYLTKSSELTEPNKPLFSF